MAEGSKSPLEERAKQWARQRSVERNGFDSFESLIAEAATAPWVPLAIENDAKAYFAGATDERTRIRAAVEEKIEWLRYALSRVRSDSVEGQQFGYAMIRLNEVLELLK